MAAAVFLNELQARVLGRLVYCKCENCLLLIKMFPSYMSSGPGRGGGEGSGRHGGTPGSGSGAGKHPEQGSIVDEIEFDQVVSD